MRTEPWRETGKSGFVIVVGFENVGMSRSTRAESGATGTSMGTGGCSIRSACEGLGATADGALVARLLDAEAAAGAADDGPVVGWVWPPQPAVTNTTATSETSERDANIGILLSARLTMPDRR
jgi:hypothetical protein